MEKSRNACVAPNCPKNPKTDKELSFFRFPKDPERSKQWVLNCGNIELLAKDISEVAGHLYLCANHFVPGMFQKGIRNSLVHTAVPTLFGPLCEDDNVQEDCFIINEPHKYKKRFTCLVPGCGNKSHHRKNVAFFRFPKSTVRCKKWVVNCRREDLVLKSASLVNSLESYRICSDHFSPSMFNPNYHRKVLVRDAIPTVFDWPCVYHEASHSTRGNPQEECVVIDEGKSMFCRACNLWFTSSCDKQTHVCGGNVQGITPRTPFNLVSSDRLTSEPESILPSSPYQLPVSVEVEFTDSSQSSLLECDQNFEDPLQDRAPSEQVYLVDMKTSNLESERQLSSCVPVFSPEVVYSSSVENSVEMTMEDNAQESSTVERNTDGFAVSNEHDVCSETGREPPTFLSSAVDSFVVTNVRSENRPQPSTLKRSPVDGLTALNERKDSCSNCKVLRQEIAFLANAVKDQTNRLAEERQKNLVLTNALEEKTNQLAEKTEENEVLMNAVDAKNVIIGDKVRANEFLSNVIEQKKLELTEKTILLERQSKANELLKRLLTDRNLILAQKSEGDEFLKKSVEEKNSELEEKNIQLEEKKMQLDEKESVVSSLRLEVIRMRKELEALKKTKHKEKLESFTLKLLSQE